MIPYLNQIKIWKKIRGRENFSTKYSTTIPEQLRVNRYYHHIMKDNKISRIIRYALHPNDGFLIFAGRYLAIGLFPSNLFLFCQ